jgi:hypothetical protein
MKTYPYLRAYMAGITIPTIFLIFIMTFFALARYVFDVSFPLERIIIFPMAIVPNLWGLWNILYIRMRKYRYLPIGFHGALLPFVQILIVYGIARLLNLEIPEFAASVFPVGFPIGIIGFYLIWKHAVAFFNAILGIE